MVTALAATIETNRSRHVRAILWRVLLLNLAIAVIKLGIGSVTGALSMVADGIHSAIDTTANLIGIIGTAIAGQPADADHPYGHRRFETLATLSIGALLLVACWEILKEAIGKLLTHSLTIVTVPSVAVMVVSMLINIATTTYSRFNGKRLNSAILLAGADESRSDLLISFSVLVGLGATALGYPLIDPLIALVMVVVIGHTAYQILRKTAMVLTDSVALNPAQIEAIVAPVAGVERVIRVRSRGPSDAIFADIDIQIDPATTADHAGAIEGEIEARLRAALVGVAEVAVHFTAEHNSHPDKMLVVRAAADALGLAVHEVTQVLTEQGTILEMHVEVDPTLTLGAAHQKVSELEARVRQALPTVNDVVTHIEPFNEEPGRVLISEHALALQSKAVKIAEEAYPEAHWHAPTIRRVRGGYAITLHCWLPGTLSIQAAHAQAERVETRIRAALPAIQRVTIHTEPPEWESVEDKLVR